MPTAIGISLYLIYRSVVIREQRLAKYGAGSLDIDPSRQVNDDTAAGGFISRLKARFGRGERGSLTDQETYHSRAVMRRVVAFSVSYFLTWIWVTVSAILNLTGVWTDGMPYPKWQIAYWHVMLFFNPLQGVWTFLVFLYPKVAGKRRASENISWFEAFRIALWSAVTGRKIPVASTKPTDATSGSGSARTKASTNTSQTSRGGTTNQTNNNVAVSGAASLGKGNASRDGAQSEEEKVEIVEEDFEGNQA